MQKLKNTKKNFEEKLIKQKIESAKLNVEKEQGAYKLAQARKQMCDLEAEKDLATFQDA